MRLFNNIFFGEMMNSTVEHAQKEEIKGQGN